MYTGISLFCIAYKGDAYSVANYYTEHFFVMENNGLKFIFVWNYFFSEIYY